MLITQQSQAELYRILEANSTAMVGWKFNLLANLVLELQLQLNNIIHILDFNIVGRFSSSRSNCLTKCVV